MPYKNIEITGKGNAIVNLQNKSKIYKGFSSLDNTKLSSKIFDFDLIKQDILNHFNTRKGERLMNPSFGSIIWDLIMEPLTPQIRELLSADITEICSFDSRVIPIEILINEYDQGYLVEITLMLKETNETSTLRLAFDQKIGSLVQ
jgi:phage baseplate assembly protein W